MPHVQLGKHLHSCFVLVGYTTREMLEVHYSMTSFSTSSSIDQCWLPRDRKCVARATVGPFKEE